MDKCDKCRHCHLEEETLEHLIKCLGLTCPQKVQFLPNGINPEGLNEEELQTLSINIAEQLHRHDAFKKVTSCYCVPTAPCREDSKEIEELKSIFRDIMSRKVLLII